jgi:hypothetical protein
LASQGAPGVSARTIKLEALRELHLKAGAPPKACDIVMSKLLRFGSETWLREQVSRLRRRIGAKWPVEPPLVIDTIGTRPHSGYCLVGQLRMVP